MTPDTLADDDLILTITDDARAKILELRAAEDDADRLALRLEVSGTTPGGYDYTYDMYFEPLADVGDDLVVRRHGDLPVVVALDDAHKLRGAVLDLPSDPMAGGLSLRNPNRPDLYRGVAGIDEPIELTGDVADRVQQLLDERINPAIAGHGGYAQLIAVEEETAYVKLGGGCQGCGLAAVTVTQGIEAAITGAIPEITRVVDSTDHAAGTNPYYEPAAK